MTFSSKRKYKNLKKGREQKQKQKIQESEKGENKNMPAPRIYLKEKNRGEKK